MKNYLIMKNKKAYYNYYILNKYEAGIVLSGIDVKYIRMCKFDITNAYVRINKNNEVFVYYMNINYKKNIYNNNLMKMKKLLLHKHEIYKIKNKILKTNYTIILLEVYLKNNIIKVKIGIAKWKKKYDKRQYILKKEQNREISKKFKVKNL